MRQSYSDHLITALRQGGAAVMRTDTIYGIVGQANNEAVVARIYAIKQRTPSKSPIILIGDTAQMFDIYSKDIANTFAKYWPGANSLILPSEKAPEWITRGNESVAYRLPADEQLRNLLQQTGPLIAPSANPEGLPPATSISEARAYFGTLVDHYEDGGDCVMGTASKLFKFEGGSFTQLR